MDKLKMHTPDLAEENYKKLAALFPDAVTETIDDEGNVVRAIDKDVLMQEINAQVVDDGQERYRFTWPDKRKSVVLANQPIAKTLRFEKEKSVGKDGTLGGTDSQNIYIEGDNLDALKILRETYLGKVKMIYIDPPYNTGKDFLYEDNFSQDMIDYNYNSGQVDEKGNQLVQNTESNGRFHTDWLNMIYPRLRLAKDLLTDDGVIFISIDEKEVKNLRKICDEILGENNFAGEIIWKNSSKNDQAYISIQHEYIECYVKNKAYNLGDWHEPKEGVDEIFSAFDEFHKKYGDNWKQIHKAALKWFKQFPASNSISDSKHYTWMDERGVYFPDNISGPHFGQYRYDIIHPVTGKVVKQPASGWRYPESTMKERIKEGLVHFGDDEKTVPCNKTYLKDTLNQSVTSVKYKDGRAASKNLEKLMGCNCFTNPKDTSVLASLIKSIGIKDNDIVLDFFSGSGSTAEAVMMVNNELKINVSFIMVQINEDLDVTLSKATGSAKQVTQNAINLCNSMNSPHYLTVIGEERIRRAGKKIKEETSADIDYGFRCFKVDSSNMKDVYYKPADIKQNQMDLFVDNIKEDRTPEDLLIQVMLDLGVLLSSKIEQTEIAGKKVYSVQDGYLIACFDEDVTEGVVTAIAQKHPFYAIFRDSSMANDSVAANFEQIFKTYSPETVRKVL